MPKRTVTCPSGCNEDYLVMDYVETSTGKEKWMTRTFYLCRKCDWEGEWTVGGGLRTRITVDGFPGKVT